MQKYWLGSLARNKSREHTHTHTHTHSLSLSLSLTPASPPPSLSAHARQRRIPTWIASLDSLTEFKADGNPALEEGDLASVVPSVLLAHLRKLADRLP